MNTITSYTISLLVMIVLSACQGGSSSGSSENCAASVNGTITFRESITLPEDAVITIQIQDTSRQDVAATVIGEQTINNPEQAPIPYEVCYDPSDIDDRFTYSVSVRITDGNGKLLGINDTHTPVITNGKPTKNVEVQVIRVGG